MAKTHINPGLRDISGNTAGWVFRKVDGQMVMGPVPIPSTKPPTQGQLDARARFKSATVYGRAVMADSVRRAPYDRAAREKRQPIFSVVVSDFFTPPVIHALETGAYGGRVGGKILVRASDDVEVVSVNVAIKDLNGTVIEQGAAVFIKEEWFYTATTLVPPNRPVKIVATAKDHAGNEGKQEVAYP